jgi:hypothetical protein
MSPRSVVPPDGTAFSGGDAPVCATADAEDGGGTFGSVAEVLVAESDTAGCASSACPAVDPERVTASVPTIASTAITPAAPTDRMTDLDCPGFLRIRDDDAESAPVFENSVSGIASLRGRSSCSASA